MKMSRDVEGVHEDGISRNLHKERARKTEDGVQRVQRAPEAALEAAPWLNLTIDINPSRSHMGSLNEPGDDVALANVLAVSMAFEAWAEAAAPWPLLATPPTQKATC